MLNGLVYKGSFKKMSRAALLLLFVLPSFDSSVLLFLLLLVSNCVLSIWCALVVILIMGHYTLRTRILAGLLF